MKIAYIFHPEWDPRGAASSAIWNYEVTRRLARTCDVTVYQGQSSSQERVECHEGVYYRSISVGCDQHLLRRVIGSFRRRGTERTNFIASDLCYAGYALQVANDLRQRKCDIVHIHNFPQFVPIIKALNPGVKIVLHNHGEWLTQVPWNRIERKLRKIDLIIGCSEFISDKIRQRFPRFAKHCHTVYMGVDPDHFCAKSVATADGINGVKRLLFVGRISPEKGLHILLEALEKVVVRYPKTHLQIVGPDWVIPPELLIEWCSDPTLLELKRFKNVNYRSYLQSSLSSALVGHVTFCSLIPHRDTVSCYHDADIFVNPSYYESLGMSTIEAMACQLPVVTTDVGGVPEVVERGKTGTLVVPGDGDALAEAILCLLGNNKLRLSMAKAARQKAIEVFSWGRICERLIGLYKSVN